MLKNDTHRSANARKVNMVEPLGFRLGRVCIVFNRLANLATSRIMRTRILTPICTLDLVSISLIIFVTSLSRLFGEKDKGNACNGQNWQKCPGDPRANTIVKCIAMTSSQGHKIVGAFTTRCNYTDAFSEILDACYIIVDALDFCWYLQSSRPPSAHLLGNWESLQ